MMTPVARSRSKPIICIPANLRNFGDHPTFMVGAKYCKVISDICEAEPVLIPPMSGYQCIRSILAIANGVLLTGSYSNVSPKCYNADIREEHQPLDDARDNLALPMIVAAIETGVPMFGICRGLQEMNVALGGTLHHAIHELPGRLDHREDSDEDLATRYKDRHLVNITAGSVIDRILEVREIMVNSLHTQGILKLSQRLDADGVAPDGTVEAASVKDARSLAIGVQWHPEFETGQNAVSLKLFAAFGTAARNHARAR